MLGSLGYCAVGALFTVYQKYIFIKNDIKIDLQFTYFWNFLALS
jgi:hypothetical protein